MSGFSLGCRQQWRSQKTSDSRWRWEWLARWRGQKTWREASSAQEAVRQATLIGAGKQPAWLAQAAADAERLVEASETPE
jgi:hypothetical protein